MANKIKIVHYVNQFFGQFGSEESASMGPIVKEEPIGPGLMIQGLFEGEGEVVATVICGDNYIAERLEEATEEIVDLIALHDPDLVIAGPAYGAGRYGVACGSVCKLVQDKLDIPAVSGMYDENPGVDIYKKDVFIIKTGSNARTMSTDLENIISLAKKLVRNEEIGLPDEEGYYRRGLIKNKRSDTHAGVRLIDMVLDKYHNRPFKTEVDMIQHDIVDPAPPVSDLSKATVVIATDGGLYPEDNPDNMPTGSATTFGIYPIEELDDLKEGDYIVCHRGYDTSYVLRDPDRLVPVDAMRKLEQEGYINKLHDFYLGTTGLMTSLANSKRIGEEMAEYIKEHDIDAVLLTST